MKSFPTLNTAIKGLILEPLQKKHLDFLVELLSMSEIQRTLFRKPTHITKEKESRALDRMYDADPAKEITYILTLKSLFPETYLGYVKIKIIDWEVKSCYLSVAIVPNNKYRGRGYAKASYNSFFEYLFSLGMMKVYGRTNETNLQTIKLNEATGFRFIGRQSNFVLYPNKTSQDDLFFERLNPTLATQYPKIYDSQMKSILASTLPLALARKDGSVTIELLKKTRDSLSAVNTENFSIPLSSLFKELVDGIDEELRTPSTAEQPVLNLQHKQLIAESLAENATLLGYPFLAYPITRKQYLAFLRFAAILANIATNNTYNSDITSEELEISYQYGCFTSENWVYLRCLFLGKNIKNSAISIIMAIQKTFGNNK